VDNRAILEALRDVYAADALLEELTVGLRNGRRSEPSTSQHVQ
jgi:hypothetical protein